MHDARMLAVSNLYDELENFAFSPTGTEMCLYGTLSHWNLDQRYADF